jgi:predicted membrane protein
MLAYIQALIKILFRKLGPEDLPHSTFLLGLTALISFLLQVIFSWILRGSPAGLAQVAAVNIAMQALCLWLLLRAVGYPTRFCQALTAMLGTGALFTVMLAPLSMLSRMTENTKFIPALSLIGILVVNVWLIFINGHILSRALSKPFAVGLVAALIYFVLNIMALTALLQAGFLNT